MDDTDQSTSCEQVIRRTRRWLEDAAIGLNMCPFARKVYADDQVHIGVEQAASFDEAVLAVLTEVERLLDAAPDDIATTLICYTDALADFDEFLEAIEVVKALLEDAGADGVLQLAHFHPAYQFADTDPDAVDNFTNRAPYPTIQLLRHAQVSEAVDGHPDPESIPERNIAKLEAMGREKLDEMWAKWS